MIAKTLAFIRDRLDADLLRRFPSDAPWVAISNVVGSGGAAPAGLDNKMALTLINIERDAAASGNRPYLERGETTAAVMAPAMAINLDVLVSAHFEDRYEDGLTMLSASIGFFQSKTSYNSQTAPDLPAGMTKLTSEWVDLDLREIHNLWTVLGGRYLPSALYKLRMITVQEGLALGQVPLITGTSLGAEGGKTDG